MLCYIYSLKNEIFSPAATAISRSQRSAESTPTSTLQTTINSTLCGDVRLLLQQQGKDGRDGRDGPPKMGQAGHNIKL